MPRPLTACFAALLLTALALAGCTEATSGLGGTGGDGGTGGAAGVGGAEPPLRHYIRDAQGRALVLHGLNVANDAKSDPLRVGATTREFVLHMARVWGFNVSRHLIFWDAIEPEPGVYDQDYLARVEERLDWYAEAGIWVVLDMHQDVYSQVFCCDGAPEWAVRTDGIPYEQQDIWWTNYAEPAVQRAFDNFWDFDGPHADVQAAYIDAWMQVVERFHDHPAVLGYDLMNEPHQGSMDTSAFERTVLPAFYDRLIARIREVDTERWIFYEPTAFIVNPGGPTDLGAVTDAREGSPRLVYAPHLYDPTVFLGVGYNGPAAIERWEANRIAELEERHPAPLVIGELGEGPSAYFADVFTMTDRLGAGWVRWSSDPFYSAFANGREPDDILDLVRVYPRRIAGDPIDFAFNPEHRVFSLVFAEREGVEGATEIFVPEARLYPDGWTLQVSDPDGSWTSDWDPDRRILSIVTDPTQAQHVIRIDPGGP